jgi:Arc/MetJ family transcription regulator
MTATLIEIDAQALAAAAAVLGTKTTDETVNTALREVGQRLRPRHALQRLTEKADQGDFDDFPGDRRAYR